MLYRCNLSDCKATFTLEKDLRRHQDTSKAHREQQFDADDPTPEEVFTCREATCKSNGREYTRLDNYERHVRTMHGNLN